MKISYNWLAAELDLAGLELSELSDLLTFAGVEVEEIQQQGVSSDLVVVAKILAAEPHPDASRLKVTTVDVGDGTPRQIVCGAQNYKVGSVVPCALPGAILPGGFAIKVGKLRGVESQGMLCSAGELGYVDKEDGLWLLDEGLQPGTPIRQLFASDTILTIEVTPNRADLLSHYGLARELAALSGRKLLKPLAARYREQALLASSLVSLQAPENCNYYLSARLDGVKVAASPQWLQQRLSVIGLRPINNVVDITNFVMHAMGHPMHAFDAAKIGAGICVRMATPGESIELLDGKSLQLDEQDLLVASAQGPALALAGIMGGAASGVSAETQSIVLESAWFNPQCIRATARKYNLGSDSSYRFERGAAVSNVLKAMQLCIDLIVELCGASLQGGIEQAGEVVDNSALVELDAALLQRVSAGSIGVEQAARVLVALGLKQQGQKFLVPDWRADLSRPIDLIEEVVRVVGLENIPSSLQTYAAASSNSDKQYDAQWNLRQRLVSLGVYECQNIKLIAKQAAQDGLVAGLDHALCLKPLQQGDVIELSLPLSQDHAVMRPSLLPGLLSSAVRNVRQGVESLRFFEIGRVFRNMGGGKAKDIENDTLGILLGGLTQQPNWQNPKPAQIEAASALALVQALFGGASVRLAPGKRQDAGFSQFADVLVDGKPVGVFARLSLETCRRLDLPMGMFAFELEMSKLYPLLGGDFKVKQLPQFPASTRDASFELDQQVGNAQIEAAVQSAKQALLLSFNCFDVFQDPSGQKLPLGRKAMAYRFVYRSDKTTLTSQQVDEAHQQVLGVLAAKIKGLSQR